MFILIVRSRGMLTSWYVRFIPHISLFYRAVNATRTIILILHWYIFYSTASSVVECSDQGQVCVRKQPREATATNSEVDVHVCPSLSGLAPC